MTTRHRQTKGPAPTERDVADPHPSNEEHPYRARNPGRPNRPVEDRVIGPNNRIHDGNPQPRPRNAETEGKP